MRIDRRTLAWLGACLLGSGLILLALSCRHEPRFKTEYRLHVPAPADSYWGRGARRFADGVREKTGGRIRIRVYYDGQLLEKAQFPAAQMVIMGSIDAAFDSTLQLAPVVPAMQVFTLPFFVGAYANVDQLQNGRTGRLLARAMERKGLILLGWGENGFRYLTNNQRQVLAPEDLRGLRIRVEDNALLADIFRGLGAVPVRLKWPAAMAAFRNGTVDGQENPMQVLLAEQIYLYHTNVTCWNYAVDPLVLYWNRQQFAAFPPDIQAQIREAAYEACQYQKALARMGLDDGSAMQVLLSVYDELPEVGNPLLFLQSRGMQVLEPTEEQLRAFESALLPVRRKWVARIGQPVYRAALEDMGLAPVQH